ncbi:hypothetical protein GQ600_10105 [Phytophthora cactorum]|nr:hypothetical protein GQ600_10105 [Phytophthora cactorum]
MTGLKPLLLLPWKTSLSYYLSPTVLSGYASKTKAPMIEIGKGQMLILRVVFPTQVPRSMKQICACIATSVAMGWIRRNILRLLRGSVSDVLLSIAMRF